METFSLTNSLFRLDVEPPVSVGLLDFDDEQVKEILFADIDTDTDMFEMVQMDGGAWELRYVGGFDDDAINTAFDLDIYVEYIAINGQRKRGMPQFRIYGTTAQQCNPEIFYIDNLASRIGTTENVTLHCHNLTYDNIDGLAVFLIANSGEVCIRIPPEDITYTLSSADSTPCPDGTQMAEFVLNSGIFGDDEGCGTYEIRFGYGDTCVNATLLDNAATTRNLSIARYKFDDENTPVTGNDYTGEGKCWFTSPIEMVTPTVGTVANEVDTGAGDNLGSEIYVKGISYDCPCENIEYYYVRLVYNTRLERRKGEMTLDGVSLKEGDIVWLAAQFDGTDGLWEVRQDEWQGLGIPVNASSGTNPCFDINPPLPVDCATFIDPGVRVTETVKTVCADDVENRSGAAVICGVSVQPGDIVVLENQSDGGNGLWRVLCSDWEYLGNDYERSGTTVDLSRSAIVQNDIDFCKCGGIFHIDYYYLNTGCYMNHARRTVKIMCGGASVVPNSDNQVVITDYSITDGMNDELMPGTSGTPGDPEYDDCGTVDTSYDSSYTLKTGETRSGCTYTEGDLTPDCLPYCDCLRQYTVTMTDDYKTSTDSNGFSIVFWQRREGNWHLYAYVASGNRMTGVEYYVMHLYQTGAAVAGNIDYNYEVTWIDRDELGNIRKDETGSPVEHTTRDAWFIQHDVTKPETVLADGFGLVDDTWVFPVHDETGEKIPLEFTSILDEDTLYDNWCVKSTTKLLCTSTADGTVGMSGVWGFRYYKSVISAEDFVTMYNSKKCK